MNSKQPEDERLGTPSLRVQMRIDTPPVLAHRPDVLIPLVDDLIHTVAANGITHLSTPEPYVYYCNTPAGHAALSHAIRTHAFTSLEIVSPKYYDEPQTETRGGEANLRIATEAWMPDALTSGIGTSIMIDAFMPTVSCRDTTAIQFTTFVARWFVPLDAVAAAVSIGDTADDPLLTPSRYEQQRGLTVPLHELPDLRRFLRGVFWGNGLGADLCARLGGQAAVLRNAPVPVTRPLGAGVWLQLSEPSVQAPYVVAALTDYLAPLLDWSAPDVNQEARAYWATHPHGWWGAPSAGA